MCQEGQPGAADNNRSNAVINNAEPDEEGVEMVEGGNVPLM